MTTARLIRLKDVLACTGLSRASIYSFMKAGEFPRSVSLGGRSVAWVEEEVDEWITDKINDREKNKEVHFN